MKELIRQIRGRKGSYIVEAAVSLPVFIIAVMVMSSVILMYACIEDCNFIMANELRRGAAMVIAGLMAEGVTEIHNVYHIDRGYSEIDKKLQALGAKIWRETIND